MSNGFTPMGFLRGFISPALLLLTALPVVTLEAEEKPDCCELEQVAGFCSPRFRMGVQSNEWDCIELPKDLPQSKTQYRDCYSYSLAKDLFGGSSCPERSPGKNIAGCTQANDTCYLIRKRKAVPHRGPSPVVCERKGDIHPIATTSSPIVLGECKSQPDQTY